MREQQEQIVKTNKFTIKGFPDATIRGVPIAARGPSEDHAEIFALSRLFWGIDPSVHKESSMRKQCLHLFWFLAAVLFFPAVVVAQNQASVMPGPGWQVMKADWGAGNRWIDVTYQVRVLLSGNGVVTANNANLGGDPAQGADKILRIQARNSRGQSQHFTFKEGASIDASQFYNYGGGIGNGGGNSSGLQVMWADWGAGNQRADVTARVRAMLRGNGLVKVNNTNLGGDPARGADKVLRISARDARGRVQQFSYKEGATIDASQFYNYGGGRG
jgi:hypothetical protein